MKYINIQNWKASKCVVVWCNHKKFTLQCWNTQYSHDLAKKGRKDKNYGVIPVDHTVLEWLFFISSHTKSYQSISVTWDFEFTSVHENWMDNRAFFEWDLVEEKLTENLEKEAKKSTHSCSFKKNSLYLARKYARIFFSADIICSKMRTVKL